MTVSTEIRNLGRDAGDYGYDDIADKVELLEAELEERTHQYHLAHVKILSREAIIEQLSETELAKDVTKAEAENEVLKCKLIEAEHSLQHALSAINDALEEGDDAQVETE